jgi:type III pantothenate kinase
MPLKVVDVGNTRIKWGRCSDGAVVEVQVVSDDSDSWQKQFDQWQQANSSKWVLTGVHPTRRDALAAWLQQRGQEVVVVSEARHLPLQVVLEKPDHVGIDRLIDAVAANSRRSRGTPAVIIDAGSAVTVDWLDQDGAFTGGAILPGMRLMAQALYDYTALLPLVDVPRMPPVLPGTATVPAISAGIFWAVAGGIQGLIHAYREQSGLVPEVYLTGGDAELLRPVLPGVVAWANMTLEGIRLTAEALK